MDGDATDDSEERVDSLGKYRLEDVENMRLNALRDLIDLHGLAASKEGSTVEVRARVLTALEASNMLTKD